MPTLSLAPCAVLGKRLRTWALPSLPWGWGPQPPAGVAEGGRWCLPTKGAAVAGAPPDECCYPQCPPHEVPACRSGSCRWPRGPGFMARVTLRFHHLSPRPSFSGNVISFKVPLASRCSNESFGKKQKGQCLERPSEGRAWARPPLTCSVCWSLSLPASDLGFPSCTTRGWGWTSSMPWKGPFCVSSC